MGLVYAPQSIGKGATSGNFRFINNPRLVGIGGGTGAIRKGLQFGYRFAKANYKLTTGITSIGVGAGVANLIGSPDNQLGEKDNSAFPGNGNVRSRSDNKYRSSRTSTRHRQQQCCCWKRNKGRLYGTMGNGSRSSTRSYHRYR